MKRSSLPAALQALVVVRREIVRNADHILRRKIPELAEKFGRVGLESDVGIDHNQLGQVREDPGVEGHQVVDVVVVFSRKFDLKCPKDDY